MEKNTLLPWKRQIPGSWYYINDLVINKLNGANALPLIMRKHNSLKILRSISFAIFESCFSYCCHEAHNCSTIQWIRILQKHPVKIINLPTKKFQFQFVLTADTGLIILPLSNRLRFYKKTFLQSLIIQQQYIP